MCSTSGHARASVQKAERTRRKQSLKIHTLLSALGVRKWTAFGSAWTLGKWKGLASSSSIFLFSPSSPLLTPVSLQLKLIIKIRANDFPLLCPELLTYKINQLLCQVFASPSITQCYNFISCKIRLKAELSGMYFSCQPGTLQHLALQ